MNLVSIKRFKKAEVGGTVMVPIPLVDRGRGEFTNLKAVITEVEERGMYKLGSVHGILKQLYARKQFTSCEQHFITTDDVPKEKVLSLR